jgi:hypothetical protein
MNAVKNPPNSGKIGSNISNQQQGIHFNLPVSTNGTHSNLSNQPNSKISNQQNSKVDSEQKMNLLQMHQNLPKSTLARDFEGKGACRQIFEDDEDD